MTVEEQVVEDWDDGGEDWDDDGGGGSPIGEEEELADLVLHEFAEYLGQSGLVGPEELEAIRPELNRVARSVARQVESHFGM
ncbi:hypothetical protein [Kitasatospora sp. NPDC088134]|uniref:hypothetical protein n=1 Tax=Kitasatospora sp. NPDC088134 TaxID=3364071 RepID=UPI00381B2DDF